MPLSRRKLAVNVPLLEDQVKALRRLSAITQVPQTVYLRDWVAAGIKWACQQSFGMNLEKVGKTDDRTLYKAWLKSIKTKKEFFGGSAKNLRNLKPRKPQ